MEYSYNSCWILDPTVEELLEHLNLGAHISPDIFPSQILLHWETFSAVAELSEDQGAMAWPLSPLL